LQSCVRDKLKQGEEGCAIITRWWAQPRVLE
jgi:hypothetical protein